MLEELFRLATDGCSRRVAAKAVCDDELLCASPVAYYRREATEEERLTPGIMPYSDEYKLLEVSCPTLINPDIRFSSEYVDLPKEAVAAACNQEYPVFMLLVNGVEETNSSMLYVTVRTAPSLYLAIYASEVEGYLERGVSCFSPPSVMDKHPDLALDKKWRLRRVLNNPGYYVYSTHSGVDSLFLVAGALKSPMLANSRIIHGDSVLEVGVYETAKKTYKSLKKAKKGLTMSEKKAIAGTDKLLVTPKLAIPPIMAKAAKAAQAPAPEPEPITVAAAPVKEEPVIEPAGTSEEQLIVMEAPVTETSVGPLEPSVQADSGTEQEKPKMKRQRKVAVEGATFDYDAAFKYFETQPSDMNVEDAKREIHNMRDLSILLARRLNNLATKQIEALQADLKGTAGGIASKKIKEVINILGSLK